MTNNNNSLSHRKAVLIVTAKGRNLKSDIHKAHISVMVTQYTVIMYRNLIIYTSGITMF